MLLSSYRSRLVFYSIIMMVFLAGILIYSHRYVNKLIRTESDTHATRIIQLLNYQLETERSELRRYASVVADDLRLKEYMFVVARIGSDSQPLTELYDRLFGWLPIDRRVIIGEDNNVYVGEEYVGLAKSLASIKDKSRHKIFYYESKAGLETVAVAPVSYRNSTLGYVAVTRQMNQAWLDHHSETTGSHFFIVEDGRVKTSTLPGHAGKLFQPDDNNHLVGENDIYHIAQINLSGSNNGNLNLWFAYSETVLNERLQQHRNMTLVLVLIGLLAIVSLGLIIIRNFNRPLLQLTQLTRKVADGELPRLEKSQVSNEIDDLTNYFSDMLQALRDKQQEVDKTREKLEQIAITDLLTGLYNRRHLQEVFPKLYAQAQRDEIGIFVFLLDIDHFKNINDTHGHMAGDKCLEIFSQKLQSVTRKNDFLFRMGGEEFLVLTTGSKSSDMIAIAEKIRITIEETPIEFEGKTIKLTTSCGVSCSKTNMSHEDVLSKMLSLADTALYEAKNAGRNKVCFSKACENIIFTDSTQQTLAC